MFIVEAALPDATPVYLEAAGNLILGLAVAAHLPNCRFLYEAALAVHAFYLARDPQRRVLNVRVLELDRPPQNAAMVCAPAEGLFIIRRGLSRPDLLDTMNNITARILDGTSDEFVVADRIIFDGHPVDALLATA